MDLSQNLLSTCADERTDGRNVSVHLPLPHGRSPKTETASPAPKPWKRRRIATLVAARRAAKKGQPSSQAAR